MTNRVKEGKKSRPATASEIDPFSPVFWTNELEVPYDQIVEQIGQEGYIEAWLEPKNGRQIEMIRRNAGLDGEPGHLRAKKNELRPDSDELLPYVLVQDFAKFKHKLAVLDVATKLLPPDVVESCRKGDSEDYDSLALCFAIYGTNPRELRQVLHVDKLYRSGSARMRIKDGPRHPQQPLRDFLKKPAIEEILAAFDKSRKDGRTSELKDILYDSDRDMVFVRRCERPDLILQGQTAVHGYRPEWISLVFFDGAKRVNISSLSVDASLEIANQIASAYYGKKCEYENESELTYTKQLERLLDRLKHDADEDLVWVELVVANTPLDGSAAMKLTDPQSRSIGRSVKDFERLVGSISQVIDSIESIKVLFSKKRVSLIFEKQDGTDDQYVVRYSDNRLNPKERTAFEELMQANYAISILSTEKRFKRPS